MDPMHKLFDCGEEGQESPPIQEARLLDAVGRVWASPPQEGTGIRTAEPRIAKRRAARAVGATPLEPLQDLGLGLTFAPHLGPSWAEFGRDRFNLADSGQDWPRSAKFGRQCPPKSPRLVSVGPASAEIGPNPTESAEDGPNVAQSRRTRPKLGRTRAKCGPTRTELVEFGRGLAQIGQTLAEPTKFKTISPKRWPRNSKLPIRPPRG